MRRSILALSVLLVVPGCDEPAGPAAANNTAAAAREPANKHPTYCFFKNADARAWSAVRDSSGNVAVKGQARIADRRYMAALGDSEVEGEQARLWLTMAPNSTGSGVAEDWWDVGATVPGSVAVSKVTVLCGKKVVAELPLKKR